MIVHARGFCYQYHEWLFTREVFTISIMNDCFRAREVFAISIMNDCSRERFSLSVLIVCCYFWMIFPIHCTSHMIGHKNNRTKGTNNAPIPGDNEQYCFRMPLKLEVHKRYWTTPL